MKRFNNILCVVNPEVADNETSIATTITQAARIAKDHQAEITFISVLKPIQPWRAVFQNQEEYEAELVSIAAQTKTEIEHQIKAIAPELSATIVMPKGIAFIEIIKQAIQQKHDLVIKCAEDMDWMERMFGSEDMHLLRKCPCPVLMLKPGQKERFHKILATVDVNDDFNELDGSRIQEQLNEQVLEFSATFSLPELSEMHIGSAWEAYAESFLRHGGFSSTPEEKVNKYVEQTYRERTTKLETLVRKMKELLGKDTVKYIQPRSHLVKGNASKEVPVLAENHNIDLIVMGTVGRVGIPGLIIGNTAESILEQAKCSVLAIKPEGFKTPVE